MLRIHPRTHACTHACVRAWCMVQSAGQQVHGLYACGSAEFSADLHDHECIRVGPFHTILDIQQRNLVQLVFRYSKGTLKVGALVVR